MAKRYKANEPVLNILLPLLNEGIFFNNGMANDVPLVSMIAASNELPEEEELAALHDRILFRVYTDYIQDNSNRTRMHVGYLRKRNMQAGTMSQKTTITLVELEAIRYRACYVDAKQDTLTEFNKLIKALAQDNIIVSDRRQNESLKVLQGNAFLSGRMTMMTDDFEALRNILWERPEDRDVINKLVAKYANPVDAVLIDLKSKFDQIKSDLSNLGNSPEASAKTIEANKRINSLMTSASKLLNKATASGKDTAPIADLINQMRSFNDANMNKHLGINFTQPGVNV